MARIIEPPPSPLPPPVAGSGMLPQSTAASPSPPSGPGAGADQPPPGWWKRFKLQVKKLKRQVLTLHYAVQDPRVGVLPRLLAFVAVAYALSPFDLIPDFIPVLGLIDDLIVLPGLILLAIHLIPAEVMATARQRAELEPLTLRKSWGMAVVFFCLWNALLIFLAWWGCTHFGNPAVQQYKVWIVVGCGALLVAGEAAWAVVQWRKERRYEGALAAAGAGGDLQEALLSSGSAAVQEYLEP